MMLLNSVREFCARHAKQHCWIALSGGLDSRVLLDICQQIQPQLSLQFHVIHVNHGLNANADGWQQQCAEYADAAGFDFHAVKVKVMRDSGDSLEEVARDARYAAFAELLQEGDLLLTAHQQNDQAETLMLQLLRGSGLKGLAAMPEIKPFARGTHGRPLLDFSRAQLLAYADERKLDWVEDDSNDILALTRNFVRHEVMNLLATRWPNVEAALARSAAHCAEAQMLLDETAHEKLLLVAGSKPDTLSAEKLLAYSSAWQRLLLRAWMEQQQVLLPDTAKMNSILQTVLVSRWDSQPCVKWGGVELRRHRDDLHLLTVNESSDESASWQWDFQAPLTTSPTTMLIAKQQIGSGLKANLGQVTVRYRIPGESVELATRGKIHLKNLFQEWGVPAWERARVPLIFCEGKLAQAVGYFLDPKFQAKEDEVGVMIGITNTQI